MSAMGQKQTSSTGVRDSRLVGQSGPVVVLRRELVLANPDFIF